MVVVTWSQEVQLPSKLQSLSLGERFNHPLHRVTLPRKIAVLELWKAPDRLSLLIFGVMVFGGFCGGGWIRVSRVVVVCPEGFWGRKSAHISTCKFQFWQNLSSKSVGFRWTKGFATMMSNILWFSLLDLKKWTPAWLRFFLLQKWQRKSWQISTRPTSAKNSLGQLMTDH